MSPSLLREPERDLDEPSAETADGSKSHTNRLRIHSTFLFALNLDPLQAPDPGRFGRRGMPMAKVKQIAQPLPWPAAAKVFSIVRLRMLLPFVLFESAAR